jgi:hypothetical protein
MFPFQPAHGLALTLAVACCPAVAQPSAAPAPYQSVFDSYQPFADEKLAPWKESNDTVGKVGGWRAYAREAAGAAPAPAAPAPPPGRAPAAAPVAAPAHKH